ncbi:MAG: methylmalonic aciduria and homocystinuria type D protein [Oscillatoriales cyanobacterium C42_A2020_001]|nr:methylmalonic aciduria and homocystinuria type D protein [Leptolyngbyaceae cyanobacterium C42_A2020_001]
MPEWSCGIGSVLIVLQRSSCPLVERTETTEVSKNQLRQNFLELADTIAVRLQGSGYSADGFDPKTGRPMYSKPGSMELDDVTVVCMCLGYPTVEIEGCSLILHPAWGTAVYPSVVLASADPDIVKRVASSVICGGWAESRSLRRERSEYHHSFKGCGSLTQ